MADAAAALRQHWPEYLIEAGALGVFMIVAGLSVLVIDGPDTPLRHIIPNADVRRALIGLAMGVTAIALIYSPWGKRSGAHMNPAVTLTFWRLGKVAPVDAVFYIAAQFAGGLAGTVLVALALGDRFTTAPVNAIATLPGKSGELAAFGAEVAIAFILMTVILAANASARLMRWTGVCAGFLVALYITIEAPISGMSLNPARSVASAVPSGAWHGIWIYLVAPSVGMLLAAELHVALGRRTPCAKLHHHHHHCIFHCEFRRHVHAETSHEH